VEAHRHLSTRAERGVMTSAYKNSRLSEIGEDKEAFARTLRGMFAGAVAPYQSGRINLVKKILESRKPQKQGAGADQR